MADRTWNQVDASIWQQNWSELAIGIAIQTITHCPNQYGIYDFPLGAINRYWRALGQSNESVAAAIQELTTAGFIRLFGDGKVWIVKKFKRELAHLVNDNYRKGAASFISQYPEIEPDFAAMYGQYYAVKPKLDLIELETSLKPVSNGFVTSESDSESEKSVLALAKANASAPRVARRRSKVAEVPALEAIEAKLHSENREAWGILKAAMDSERVHKSCKDTVKAAFLAELLASAKRHGFTAAQVSAGMLACAKASNGVAENERYFRKAAAGYNPETTGTLQPSREPETGKHVRYSKERGWHRSDDPPDAAEQAMMQELLTA